MNVKNLSIGLILLSSISLMSFVSKPEIETEKTELTFTQDGWGPWKTTTCFRYLEYQVKKADYAGKWYIRFKNGYNKSISMTVEVSGNTGTKEDSGRFTIKSGGTSSQYYFVDDNSTRINFNVDKVKFGDSSWGGPYAECDY